MDLNSLLKDMGLVDAFSATFSQVDIEQAPSCEFSCSPGCSSSCDPGCSAGCTGSNKG